jgi:hypothetical protein
MKLETKYHFFKYYSPFMHLSRLISLQVLIGKKCVFIPRDERFISRGAIAFHARKTSPVPCKTRAALELDAVKINRNTNFSFD